MLQVLHTTATLVRELEPLIIPLLTTRRQRTTVPTLMLMRMMSLAARPCSPVTPTWRRTTRMLHRSTHFHLY